MDVRLFTYIVLFDANSTYLPLVRLPACKSRTKSF